MTRVKVTAVHYIESSDWKSAEQLVELKQSNPDVIVSSSASTSSRDIISFEISKRILEQHNKMYFDESKTINYDEEVNKLTNQLISWLEGIVQDVINSNEDNWS